MKKENTFTAKQVGGRIKERRTELNITMPELGRRVGVNKSTIQRYEADGVDPKRTPGTCQYDYYPENIFTYYTGT